MQFRRKNQSPFSSGLLKGLPCSWGQYKRHHGTPGRIANAGDIVAVCGVCHPGDPLAATGLKSIQHTPPPLPEYMLQKWLGFAEMQCNINREDVFERFANNHTGNANETAKSENFRGNNELTNTCGEPWEHKIVWNYPKSNQRETMPSKTREIFPAPITRHSNTNISCWPRQPCIPAKQSCLSLKLDSFCAWHCAAAIYLLATKAALVDSLT